jgi:hypothetical protein
MAAQGIEVRSIAAQLELIRMSVEAECAIAEMLRNAMEFDGAIIAAETPLNS